MAEFDPRQDYYILSGEIFRVKAVSRDQAFAKFYVSQGVATPEQATKDFNLLYLLTEDDNLDVEFVEVATQIVE
jgi:hypothetical protein